MQRLNLMLYMDISDSAPEGPGWYVAVASDTQSIIGPVAIPEDALQGLTLAFHTALEKSEAELPPITVAEIVGSGRNLIHQALKDQLETAQRWAGKVGVLRRKLSAYSDTPKSSATVPSNETRS